MLPSRSTIHDLPTELVSMILLELCPPSTPIRLPFCSQHLIRFSQVCGTWREIARKHPKLWTVYELSLICSRTKEGRMIRWTLPSPEDESEAESNPLAPVLADWTPEEESSLLVQLAKFISNAGSQDIAMSVLQGDQDSGQEITMTLLKTFCRRFSHLSLNISHDTVCALDLCDPLHFDHLARLRVRMHPHPDKTDRPPHRARHWHCEGLGILSTTPRLTEIDLGYVEWLPDHLPRLFLPAWGPRLQQLTTFHGRNVWLGFANVIELLKTAAQLIHCDIRCNLDDLNPTEEEQTPTLLPNLLNLNVTFRTMFPRFWNFITAPKLRLLSISSVYDEDDRWGQQEFIAFRLRSKFTLIRLLLRFDFSDIADDIMDILNLCQGVRELTLRWTGPSYDPALHISRLVEELGAGSYDSLWLPNLSSLHIDLTQESLQALTSRVQTQARAAGGRADRFQVLFSTELEEAEYERLHGTEVRALRETGCRVGVEKMSFYGGEYYAVGGEEEGDGDGDEHEEEDEGEDMEVDEGEGEEMAVEGDEDEDENGEGEEMQVEQGEGEVIGTDIPQEEDLNWNEYVVNNDECWLVE